MEDTREGHTPLTLACRYGDIRCLELLIDHGADVKATCHKYRANGLHLAAAFGHDDAAALLIRRCQDPDFVDALDGHGKTPLQKALEAMSWSAAWSLLEHGAVLDVLQWNDILPPGFSLYIAENYTRLSGDTKSDTIEKLLSRLCELDLGAQALSPGGAESETSTDALSTGLPTLEVLERVRAILDGSSNPEHCKPYSAGGQVGGGRKGLSIYELAWRFACLVLHATDYVESEYGSGSEETESLLRAQSPVSAGAKTATPNHQGHRQLQTRPRYAFQDSQEQRMKIPLTGVPRNMTMRTKHQTPPTAGAAPSLPSLAATATTPARWMAPSSWSLAAITTIPARQGYREAVHPFPLVKRY